MSSAIATQMMRKFGTPVTHNDPVTGDQAVTVRPASTALFVIDSADRYNSVTASRGGTVSFPTPLTSPYDFTITRNQSLLNGFFTRLALTEVVFPYYVPNINGRTSTISVDSSEGGQFILDLNVQTFYTPAQLAAAFQAELIAEGAASATVTYRPTGDFYIDAGVGNTIAFSPTTSPGLDPPLLESSFQLFDLMGFGIPASTVPSQIQATRVTRCRYTEYIDIVCTQLTYNQELKDAATQPISRDVLARIYLECENDQPMPVNVAGTVTRVESTVPGTYPFTIYRQFQNPKQILWNKVQPVGSVRFEVYDDRGDPLDIATEGSAFVGDAKYPDWRMTLLVTEN